MSKYLITCDMCRTVGTRECALNKRVETRKVSSKVFYSVKSRDYINRRPKSKRDHI